jgi:hypothetical protein
MAAAAGGDFPSAVADATVCNKHHGQLYMVSDSSNVLAYCRCYSLGYGVQGLLCDGCVCIAALQLQ